MFLQNLFNSDMTLLSTSTVSDRGEINYIKQQETRITMTRGRIDMRVMPEQEPLKWIIPAHLLEGYVRQAAHGLSLRRGRASSASGDFDGVARVDPAVCGGSLHTEGT